jgi:hypothetical protein
MVTLSHISAFLAAAGLTAGAFAAAPAVAVSEAGMAKFLPLQGFSQTLGSKQAVGFFEEKGGRCRITLMVAEAFDEASDRTPPSATRITTTIEPEQSTTVESVELSSLKITCGADAKTVSVEASPSASSSPPIAMQSAAPKVSH